MKLRLLLTLAVLTSLSACGGDDPPPIDPGDDLFPIDDADTVRMGAPPNSMLPFEGKADETLPATFDLVSTQSPIQNQGRRGVCSIFGTIAYMEHLYLVEGTLPDPNFSEQFLQWSTKVEGGSFPNTGGSSASANLSALRRFGTVEESDWPYQSNAWGTSDDMRCDGSDAQPTICYTNGDPPASALASQRWFVPSGGRWINSSAQSIKSHMVSTNTGVQVGGDFFYQAWGHGGSRIPRYSGYRNHGYIVAPNQADIDSSNEHRAGHSFLLVGWDDDLEVQAIDDNGELAVDAAGEPVMQKGFFLFKNSWGTDWATENPFGAGYGWIAYEYVERHLSAYVAGVPDLDLTERCSDERDNDFNGQTDCADAACAMDRACIDPVLTYDNTTGGAIPDADSTGLVSTIDVTDTGPISSVSVSVDITHPYRGDLTISLEKNGTSVVLFDREGASEDDLVRTFDVGDFDGQDAAGTWSLVVVDHEATDVGTLNGWSLTITTCAGGDCDSMPSVIQGQNTSAADIPDDDPTGVTSDIVIADAGTIATLRVAVDISHTFLAELVIAVSKDGGAEIELMREEFLEGSMLMRTFTVEELVGQTAAGTYTLRVSDVAAGDMGTLNGWSVEILTE